MVENFIASQASSPSTSKVRHLNPSQLLIGGTSSLREDIQTFKSTKPDILVGTPGRLEEFLLGSSSLENGSSHAGKGKGKPGKRSGAAAIHPLPPPPRSGLKPVCSVKNIEMLILDEADRLLELGFQASLNRIFGILPKQRRTGCFSATMTEGLGELCRVGLRNPVKVVVKVERKGPAGSGTTDVNTPSTLQNTYAVCRTEEKLARLVRLLHSEMHNGTSDPRDNAKIIVYLATCACVDYFCKVRAGLFARARVRV